jgi:hypothetical protein
MNYHQTIEEFISKTLINNQGKFHQQFSNHIAVTCVKLLREVNKVYPGTIQQKLSSLTSLLDDLKRAKNAHNKNLDKYTKLIKDTENQLRARDNLLLFTNQPNTTGGETSSDGGGGADNQSVSSTQSSSNLPPLPPKEERFGRSFSKIINTMKERGGVGGHHQQTAANSSTSTNPTTASSSSVPSSNPVIMEKERKMEDKCRDLFKEIDIAEKSLAANSENINSYRRELVTHTNMTIGELIDTEFGRLSALKDSLMNFLQFYEDASLTFLLDPLSSLSQKFSFFLTVSEENDLKTFLNSPNALTTVDFTHPMVNFMSNTAEITENFSSDKIEISVLFVRIARLTDNVSSFIDLIVKSANSILEVVEIDRTNYKNIQSLFEKNGFQRIPSENSVYLPGSNSSLVSSSKFLVQSMNNIANTSNCGQLLSSLELPVMKKSVESFICGISRWNDLLGKSIESFVDDVKENLFNLKERLTVMKKELIDKSFAQIKKLETSFQNLSKTRVELKKLKTLLKERRTTVKQAREEVEGADANRGSVGDNTKGEKEKERDSFNDPEAAAAALKVSTALTIDTADHNVTPSVVAAAPGTPSNPANSVNTEHPQEEDEFPLNTTGGTGTSQSSGPGTGRKASLLLSTVKFKQSFGIESAADRLTRIEHQISTLEDKEVELTQKQDQLTKTLTTTDITSAKLEIDLILQTNLESFLAIIFEYKSAIDLTSKLQLQKAQNCRDTMKTLKDSLEKKLKIDEDITSLKKLFADSSAVVGGGALEIPANELFDIPSVEVFKPIVNQYVLDGRIRILGSAPTPVVSTKGGAQQPASLQLPGGGSSGKQQPLPSSPVTGEGRSTSSPVTTTGDKLEKGATPAVPGTPPPVATGVGRRLTVIDEGKEEADMSSHVGDQTEGGQENNNNNNNTNTTAANEEGGGADQLADDNQVILTRNTSDTEISRKTTMSASTRSNSSNASSALVTRHPFQQQPSSVDNELRRFGLSAQDKVLEWFSCALYPKKGILTHGK